MIKMNIEKMNLVKRNTLEIVNENEIIELLNGEKKPVVYCGYEPSGDMHLGHLVTGIKLKDLTEAGFKIKILLADWHAWLNKKGTMEEIHKAGEQYQKAFESFGLKNAKYVLGTSFQQTTEYIEDVLKLSLNVTINRGLRAMQKVARDVDNATISQSIYPLMQIVDMKYLEVDVAEAGIEQRKIHMLSRETLHEIGYKKVSFIHTKLINSLTGANEKMSSSDLNSMISVKDSTETIKKKINSAFCEAGNIEQNPVMDIMELIIYPLKKTILIERPEKFGGNLEYSNIENLKKDFAEKKLHPMDLKQEVSKSLNQIIEPIRKEFR